MLMNLSTMFRLHEWLILLVQMFTLNVGIARGQELLWRKNSAKEMIGTPDYSRSVYITTKIIVDRLTFGDSL